MKTKSITVSSGWFISQGGLVTITREGEDYRVEKVQNSTEFRPTQMLTKAQVTELCEAKDWTVNIVAPSR